ncbi:MAG: hypothetical protein EPN22_05185 [Nitrospirae bacterium]|nr:MAG: hypothetical protein EPN22_05185 [Nitrospirota bacterium]
MKGLMIAVAALLAFSGGHATVYAADHSGHMGHMEHSAKCGDKSTGVSGQSDVKSWSGMAVHIVPMMQSISDMSIKTTMSLKKEIDNAQMKNLSEIIDQLSSHMSELSTMLFMGSATEQSMHELHMKINETATRVEKI